MENPKIYFQRIEGRAGGLSYQLTRLRHSSWQVPETWAPAINAYRCRDSFVVCAELAGVDRASIDVRVESRRLWIIGRRSWPEPDKAAGPALQVLALEIDHGPFAREVALPEAVDPGMVRAEQRNGLLWIRLPLQSPA